MRTPTYEDHIRATWPWEFTAEVEMDIPELGITLVGRCDAYQEYEGADEVVNWDDFLVFCEAKEVKDEDEFFEKNGGILSYIIMNTEQRESRTKWVIKDRL